ncbi:MAG: DUF4215 domain-containing protein [Candidatus Parcubacteria bacterium]|nr:DUF4215 domain-containing protein [Candidatus Parcubacteria bacterium]
MAIDFLGKGPDKKMPPPKVPVQMHEPVLENITSEKVISEKKPEPAQKPAEKFSEEPLGEVNLVTSLKSYLFKKKIVIIIILLFVFSLIILGTYYLLTRPPKIVINENKPPQALICGNGLIEFNEQCDVQGCAENQVCNNCQCQQVSIEPICGNGEIEGSESCDDGNRENGDGCSGLCQIEAVSICGNGVIETGEACDLQGCAENQVCNNCQCRQVIIAPICGNGKIEATEQCDLAGCSENQACENCRCEDIILPDTDLAPLRGTVVKFAADSTLYLIDWGGVLRKIDVNSVVFSNGLAISKIDPGSIYTINDRFRSIRQAKEVSGYVDWDPRVLSEAEYLTYK